MHTEERDHTRARWAEVVTEHTLQMTALPKDLFHHFAPIASIHPQAPGTDLETAGEAFGFDDEDPSRPDH